MANPAPITPGSVTEAYEKTASTPAPHKFDGGAGGSKKKFCSPLVVANTLIGAGALLAVVAVVYGAALPGVITSTIEDGVATCKVSDVQKEAFLDNYGDCKDCTPYYYNLNMFNVTNAMDFLEKGDKLKVTEVGPYAYRRHQIKVDVQLADDKNSVSYKMYTWHEFAKDKSCATCLDTDQVVSWDISYLNVIAQAGGELGFLRRLVAGTLWARTLTASEREEIVQANKEKMMRWINGLNSNQPEAWKLLGSTVLGFLGASVNAIPDVGNMTGLTYAGVFAKRPISDWALGFPSMLAGIGLGTNWHAVCKNTTALNYDAKCSKCTAATCPEIWSECKRCAQGTKVIALNPLTCGRIVSKYAAVYGEAEAIKAVNGTCSLCASSGVCAAPLPGAAEGSGLDYSKTAPNPVNLNTYTQLTGCDDKSKIGEYTMYDGLKTSALWANLDSRRNPTLAELNAFAVYGNCDAKTANMTCSDVFGADGTSTPPAGASITGFPEKVKLQSTVMYLTQAKQNISLLNTGEIYDLDGAKLTRFIPPADLLVYTADKAAKGTGIPVDGVQPMSFNVGFLAFLSFPMFLTGDKSLYEGVEVTMFDGKIASKDTLYDSAGKLKQEYYDRYQTTVDVEAGTGKTMRAHKRLQASYALAKSQFTADAPMSDVLWPSLKPEVISPAYFGEEVAIITSKRLSTYKTIQGVLKSLLPVLIVGVIVGLGITVFGFLKRRKAVAAKNTYGAAV